MISDKTLGLLIAILGTVSIVLLYPIYQQYNQEDPNLYSDLPDLKPFPLENYNRIHSNNLKFPSLFEDEEVTKSIESIETYLR